MILLGFLAAAIGRVIQLDKAGFNELRAAGASMSVVFFAPWCGHCKNLKPEYEKAGQELAGITDIYMVDCTDEATGGRDVCSEFSVQGFPTIKFINAETGTVDYNGAREARALRSFVLYNMKKPFTEHKAEAFGAAFREKDGLYIATESSAASSYLFKMAKGVSAKTPVFVLLGATPEKLAAAGMDKYSGKLVLLLRQNGKVTAYAGANAPADIGKWLDAQLK